MNMMKKQHDPWGGMSLAKRLEEMSSEELGKLFPIIIAEFNPAWAALYLSEKKLIEQTVGTYSIVRIQHYGSTSIPGISAKPTIDILLEVCDNIDKDNLISQFKSIGYHYSPQPDDVSPHMMFMKGYTQNGFKGQAYHVHVRYSGDWDELYFRDYLILHPEIAGKYVQLKQQLKEKYEYDREAYTRGKTEFIKRVTNKARKELTRNKTVDSKQ